MVNLFGSTMNVLENSLDYSSLKNKTISHNIANVDTPNYKAQDTSFKNVLDGAINSQMKASRTHVKHLPFNNEDKLSHIFTKKNTMYNHNGNNVDIDKEMADLAKNQIYYQSMIDRVNGKFNKVQTVLRGGS